MTRLASDDAAADIRIHLGFETADRDFYHLTETRKHSTFTRLSDKLGVS